MTPQMFNHWIRLMKYRGLARTDTDCASLLGIGLSTLARWKESGADKRTALACAALIKEIPPFDLAKEGELAIKQAVSLK